MACGFGNNPHDIVAVLRGEKLPGSPLIIIRGPTNQPFQPTQTNQPSIHPPKLPRHPGPGAPRELLAQQGRQRRRHVRADLGE
jgi:hypothetical protein